MNYQETMNYLQQHGKEIGAQKTKEALEVQSAYKFHYAAPGDPGGKMLLCVAVNKYNKAFNLTKAEGQVK